MDFLVAIDTLDDLVHNAGAIPFTGAARMPREELEGAAGQIHATLPPDVRARADAEGLLDRLDAVVAAARPLPLTRQVRFDKDELYEVLDGIRGAIVPGEPA
jgi:hypothetical protein